MAGGGRETSVQQKILFVTVLFFSSGPYDSYSHPLSLQQARWESGLASDERDHEEAHGIDDAI